MCIRDSHIPANVKHWHGAAANSWFAHLAFELSGENTSNEWLETVTDEEYDKIQICLLYTSYQTRNIDASFMTYNGVNATGPTVADLSLIHILKSNV